MKTIVYILLLVFSWQILAKGAVLVLCQANQNYIAANLCEQKTVKNNTCQGKCYLKKQLKKQEAQKMTPQSLKDKYEVSAFILHQLPKLIHSFNTIAQFQINPKVIYLKIINGRIFRPPCFSF